MSRRGPNRVPKMAGEVQKVSQKVPDGSLGRTGNSPSGTLADNVGHAGAGRAPVADEVVQGMTPSLQSKQFTTTANRGHRPLSGDCTSCKHQCQKNSRCFGVGAYKSPGTAGEP